MGPWSSLLELAAVATGSAAGALARFALGRWLLAARAGQPLAATVVVNLSGCALAGFLAASLLPANVLVGSLVLTGFLGSYTTVSAFSVETLGLWQAGRRVVASAYVVTSAAGGVLLAAAGSRAALAAPW